MWWGERQCDRMARAIFTWKEMIERGRQHLAHTSLVHFTPPSPHPHTLSPTQFTLKMVSRLQC